VAEKLKVNDRVKRLSGEGCIGVVKEIRAETTSIGDSKKEKPVLISVLWDNGTISYFSPEGLQVAK
jgi:hypothetical protein